MKKIPLVYLLLPFLLSSCFFTPEEKEHYASIYAQSENYHTYEGKCLVATSSFITFEGTDQSSVSSSSSTSFYFHIIPAICSEIKSRGFYDHVGYGDSFTLVGYPHQIIGESGFQPLVSLSAGGKVYLEKDLGIRYLLDYVKNDLR